jgi:hypothetical protein
MSMRHRKWVIIPMVGLIMAAMACALPGAIPQAIKPTATATSTPTAALSAGGINGSSDGSGSSNSGTGGSNGGTGGNSGGTGGNNDGSNGNSPTQLPDISIKPYVVKQIETLGGEVISGVVCSLTKPFSVLSVTPHVTFSFYFVPQNTQRGTVSYAYTIASAGESHDATGTYSLNQVQNDGTLQLSMTASDHVVFKGFDGNIPTQYKFNLVPSGNISCP